MSSAGAVASAFYPPRIVPPARLPYNPRLLLRLLTDSMLCIPEPVYREPIVVLRPWPARSIAYVTAPDLIKTVLVDRRELFPKSEIFRRLAGPVERSVLLVDGADWHWQRQIVAPLLKSTEIHSHVPAMAASAQTVVDKWRVAPAGSIHAIDEDMVAATYAVSANTLLGGSGDLVSIIADGYAGYFSSITWSILYGMLRLPNWMPQPGRRASRRIIRRMRQTVTDLLRARRTAVADTDDLLNRLILATNPETGETMSDEQIVDNLLLFLVAGHESTAKALTWTLYLVSKAPNWEARMLEEIEQVVGSGPVEGDHIDRLVVVQQVLKEALRLFPPFPEITRVAIQDVDLGGHAVEAGTLIDLPIYAIHRHRKLWDDPDRFDPSRFEPAKEARHSRYQFMPFGGGPRTCLAASFAMTVGTTLLATFVRAAHLQCPEAFEPAPVARWSLISRNGMKLGVTMRGASWRARQ